MFRTGARCGILPAQLLELNLEQFQAVVDGYSERLIDEQINAIWSGYYSAYYQSKHPKSPTQLIEKLHRADKPRSKHKDTDMDAEIDKFAAMETKFFLAQQGGDTHGV